MIDRRGCTTKPTLAIKKFRTAFLRDYTFVLMRNDSPNTSNKRIGCEATTSQQNVSGFKNLEFRLHSVRVFSLLFSQIKHAILADRPSVKVNNATLPRHRHRLQIATELGVKPKRFEVLVFARKIQFKFATLG